MWRTLDTGRAGAVGVGVTIDPQGSINRHARARHVPATESGLCGGQLVRLARRQPPRRHGQPRRRAQRNDDQSDILPKLRSVPFERAAHGPMTQRHARDTERAARNEAAGRAAMATGASGRSVRLAAAAMPSWVASHVPARLQSVSLAPRGAISEGSMLQVGCLTVLSTLPIEVGDVRVSRGPA